MHRDEPGSGLIEVMTRTDVKAEEWKSVSESYIYEFYDLAHTVLLQQNGSIGEQRNHSPKLRTGDCNVTELSTGCSDCDSGSCNS